MYLNRNDDRPGARIIGLGTCLPEPTLTSAEMEDRIRNAGIEIADGFIERATGVASRHIAPAGTNASDLAVTATREALADAHVDIADVDVLMFAAASHDVTEPATANIVQAKLGADNTHVFDLKNACNSLLTALDVAEACLQSHRARVIVVATGEVPSRFISLDFESRQDIRNRMAHLTLGDAGGAIVLTLSPNIGEGVLATAATSRGNAWQLGTVLSFGTMYPRDTSPERAYFQSRGEELEEQARVEIPRVGRAVLDAAAWTPDSVGLVAGHQHSVKLGRALATGVGISAERVMLPIRYAGNAVSANVPLALAEAKHAGALRSGTRVLLCGGSAGFSAIAAAVAW